VCLGVVFWHHCFWDMGIELFLQIRDRTYIFLQQEKETATGTAVTATASSAVATASTITETRPNTQMEETPWSAGDLTETVSDSQAENEIEASLKEENLQLGMGEQVKMPVKNHSGLHVTYKSKNKRVVSINRKGNNPRKKTGEDGSLCNNLHQDISFKGASEKETKDDKNKSTKTLICEYWQLKFH